jgi:hypothetical protein
MDPEQPPLAAGMARSSASVDCGSPGRKTSTRKLLPEQVLKRAVVRAERTANDASAYLKDGRYNSCGGGGTRARSPAVVSATGPGRSWMR